MEQVTAVVAAIAVAFGPLAIGVTKLVDGVRNIWAGPKWLWVPLALGLGIVVCVGWSLNPVQGLVKLVPALSDVDLSGTAGEVLSGLGVGAMASYWHERMDLASSRAKAAHP